MTERHCGVICISLLEQVFASRDTNTPFFLLGLACIYEPSKDAPGADGGKSALLSSRVVVVVVHMDAEWPASQPARPARASAAVSITDGLAD